MSAPTTSEDRPRKRRPYAPRVPIEQRREQLLDTALAVIVSEGYDRISIDAIAKRAGVARSVVYGAYDHLDALLTALLDRQQARAFGQLLATIPDDPAERGAPATFAAETVRRMSAMLRQDPDTWRLILAPPGNMPTVVRERVEADRNRFRRRVEAWLAHLPADRNGPALDAAILAHALVACAEHFGRLALTDPGTFEPERLIEQVRVLLGALWPGTR